MLLAIGGLVGTVGAAIYKSKMDLAVEQFSRDCASNPFYYPAQNADACSAEDTVSCAEGCILSLFASVLAMVTGAAAAACVDLGCDRSLPRESNRGCLETLIPAQAVAMQRFVPEIAELSYSASAAQKRRWLASVKRWWFGFRGHEAFHELLLDDAAEAELLTEE